MTVAGTEAAASTAAPHAAHATHRKHVTAARSLESLSLLIAAVAFVATAVAALIAFRFTSAPIAGHGSAGQFAAIASAVTALLVFVVGRYVVHVRGGKRRLHLLDYVDIVALAFAHSVIALLGWTVLVVVLADGFQGAVVFAIPVLILTGAAAALTAYLVFHSAVNMNLQLLAVVLASFMVLGVIASMLTASDPLWWHDNLSALGMTTNVSAIAFNLTIIVAGILVTTLARYATRSVPSTHPRGLEWVRGSLVLVGILLGLVGVFPVNLFWVLHTGIASGMVAVFAFLIIRLRAWIPGMPRTFVLLGWLFLALITFLVVLFAVGYYTLTAVELVAGILIFAWIILFIRNIAALESDVRNTARG